MDQINEKELIKFLKDNIEPIEDSDAGEGYRASVYLIDGTHLPCVVFRNSKKIVQLAKRRFGEERTLMGRIRGTHICGYNEIIKSFVAQGNRVNIYDIAKAEKSKYAFPISLLKQIYGETTMSWTAFVAEMKDGKHFGFGTSFLNEFFQMPENYTADDVVRIINHSYVSPNGEVKSLQRGFFEFPDDYKNSVVYRSRPFFECFIDDL